MPRYQKIPPQVKSQLEQQLAERRKKQSRSGLSARLLKGDEVKKFLDESKQDINKVFADHTKRTGQELDKKTKEAVVNLNKRIDAVLAYMQAVVQQKVDNMPVPENGRTPSRDEITAALLPLVNETKKEYAERIEKIEKFITQEPGDSGLPKDTKSLEDFVKSKIPKDLGGGSGPGYFFELLDTPAKVGGLRGAYRGYEGKVVKVSADGKKLEFGDGGGSTIDELGDIGDVDTTDTTANYVLTRKADGTFEMAAPPGASGGEANTVTNVGTAGVGLYKEKVGVDLKFKKLNAGSAKVTVTDDTGNDEVDIDVDPSQINTSDLNNDAGWTGATDISGKQDILAEGAFVDGDKTKLNGIETGADVTDATNVAAAGALMDSEVTNLAQVKAFDSSDYATAAQGALADSATQPGDLATVATTGAYADLSGTPDLTGLQTESVVVSGSLTAVLDTYYVNVATATYTDPSPVEGKGFIVFVRNGTATVGGTGYSTAGTIVHRIFHSGSWANYVYQTGSGGSGSNITYSDTEPSTPSDGDLWVDTSEVLDAPVRSADITSIVALTQAEYDALTPDANALYVITD